MSTLKVYRTERGALRIRSGGDAPYPVPADYTVRDVRKAAAHFSLSPDAINRALNALGDKPEVEIAAAELNEPAGTPMAFTLRRLASSEAQTLATFDAALAAPVAAGEWVIEWEGTSIVCAVDLDFHGEDPPAADALRLSVAAIRPVPRYWWRTLHGGLRLVYFAGGGLLASDCAATAGYQLVRRFPSALLELLSRTRRPPSEVHTAEQSYDCDSLRSLYGEAQIDDHAAAQWLADRGLEPGQRYPHTQCPVNSYAAAEHNPGAPVVVTDQYVRCYICERDGRCHGSKDAGYFPLAALVGGSQHSRLKTAVDNFVHWGHARYVMAQEAPQLSDKLGRAIYGALLRMTHKADPRIDPCFAAGEPNGIVRFNGYWATSHGEPYRLSQSSRLLSGLPSTWNDRAEPVAARVELLAQSVDLAPNGYPALTPIWGCQLTSAQQLPGNRVYTVLQTAELRNPAMQSAWPQYVPVLQRMPENIAWDLLDGVFPGVDRNAVRLLIAAKGCSELKAGLPPMIFITGPTGAGKTGVVLIAAAICGDHVKRITYNKDPDRLFAMIREAREKGSYAAFDEFIKGARRARRDAEAAMEVVLDLDEDAVAHKLYIGPVVLGDLPVFVWCDTAVPAEVAQHKQIGRRVHHVYLAESRSWEGSLAAAGIREPGALRTRGTPDLIAAANAILSDVIDEFFGPEPTDFATVAAKLGFAKLMESDLSRERVELIRELFTLVCGVRDGVTRPSDADRKQWSHDSWRIIDCAADSRAATVWESLCDRRNLAEAKAVDEVDIKAALGLAAPTTVERRAKNRRVAIRFVGKNGAFNEELKS